MHRDKTIFHMPPPDPNTKLLISIDKKLSRLIELQEVQGAEHSKIAQISAGIDEITVDIKAALTRNS